MPSITLTLSHPLNQAVQPLTNDIAYYASTSSYNLADSSTVNYADSFIKLGPITAVNFPQKQITCDVSSSTVLPATNDFVFFSKDNRAFNGHLTLCRVKDFKAGLELAGISEDYKDFKLGTITADSISVYQSQLTSTGPIYTVLGKYKLK